MKFKSLRRRVGIGVAFAGMLAAAFSSGSRAQTTTIDVNNAVNWTIGTGAGANSSVTFGFDHSTVGVPQAPGSSTTTAMVMRANTSTSGSLAQGITVSPNGVNLTGDYTIRAMIWGNTIGGWTTGGALSTTNGATQFVGLGVGYTGGTLFRSGASVGGGSGVWFASAIDGGFSATSTTIRDYSAFTGSGASAANFVTATTAYFANASGTAPQDNNNPYYSAAFPGQIVNTINSGTWATLQNQTVLTGTTTNGVPGMAWREYTIARTGSTVTWSISGTPIATLTGTSLTLDGPTSLTFFDATASVAPSPNLVFGLVSSYSVEVVPEPSSIALTVVGIASGGVIAYRRRRRHMSPVRG